MFYYFVLVNHIVIIKYSKDCRFILTYCESFFHGTVTGWFMLDHRDQSEKRQEEAEREASKGEEPSAALKDLR